MGVRPCAISRSNRYGTRVGPTSPTRTFSASEPRAARDLFRPVLSLPARSEATVVTLTVGGGEPRPRATVRGKFREAGPPGGEEVRRKRSALLKPAIRGALHLAERQKPGCRPPLPGVPAGLRFEEAEPPPSRDDEPSGCSEARANYPEEAPIPRPWCCCCCSWAKVRSTRGGPQ